MPDLQAKQSCHLPLSLSLALFFFTAFVITPSILYVHLFVYCLPSPLEHKLQQLATFFPAPCGHSVDALPASSSPTGLLSRQGQTRHSRAYRGWNQGPKSPASTPHCWQECYFESTNPYQWLISFFHSFSSLWFQVSTNTKRPQGPWEEKLGKAKSALTQDFKRKLNMHI